MKKKKVYRIIKKLKVSLFDILQDINENKVAIEIAFDKIDRLTKAVNVLNHNISALASRVEVLENAKHECTCQKH